jgi:hypothetical protein
MKKLFVLTSALTLLFASALGAQTTSTTTLSQSSLTRWRENLKIRYFGELLGSNLEKWDDNQYDQNGNKLATPANLYNQFNVQYKVLNRTSLLVSPRFYAQIGDRNDLAANEDPHTVVMDDWQFGFVQELYKSKAMIYNGRLTHRHPFSTASRNSMIDSQVEYQNDLTFFPTAGLTVLHWNTYRYYAYEAQKNEDRYRINFTTIFNYDFNDKWKMQLYHELDLQHKAPKYGKKDMNKQGWNYFEKNKNHVAIGIGYNPTPALSIIPFVKALNDEDWSARNTQLGLWVLGKVF